MPRSPFWETTEATVDVPQSSLLSLLPPGRIPDLRCNEVSAAHARHPSGFPPSRERRDCHPPQRIPDLLGNDGIATRAPRPSWVPAFAGTTELPPAPSCVLTFAGTTELPPTPDTPLGSRLRGNDGIAARAPHPLGSRLRGNDVGEARRPSFLFSLSSFLAPHSLTPKSGSFSARLSGDSAPTPAHPSGLATLTSRAPTYRAGLQAAGTSQRERLCPVGTAPPPARHGRTCRDLR